MENFLSHTDEDRRAMLSAIGVSCLEELFDVIPDGAKFKNFNLPEGLDEFHAEKELRKLAAANKFNYLNFLGGGSYPRHIPAAVGAVTSRFEFLSAYTPYQPEISQGTLQAMYEFQTFITKLTSADVSNASVYDGATAAAEALLMAVRLKKKRKVWVSENINPNYLEVIKTYLWAQDIELEIGKNHRDSKFNADEYSAKLFQYPNYFGELEEIPQATMGELIIASVDLVALAIIEPPVADIYTGDFGSLGLPLNFGGPYGGFIATKDEYKRQLAGRIIGKTVDKNGKDAYCLTLSAREQHIRREKATSNICSNQSLCALSLVVYLSLLGEEGFKKVSLKSYKNAHKLAKMLEDAGFKIDNKNFFSEFVLNLTDDCDKFIDFMRNKKILAGIKIEDKKILVSTTEILDDEDLENYAKLAGEFFRK